MRSVFAILLLVAACASPEGHAPVTLENDGAWVRVFQTDRDTAFHAAMAVLTDEGYTVETANPLAGSFTATSEVKSVLGSLSYQRARVMVEGAPTSGVRVRMQIIKTYQPDGAGRRPNNDRPVNNRELYESLFRKIAREIAKA